MRRAVAALVVGTLLSWPSIALADAFRSCWIDEAVDTFGKTVQITRCRLAGGDIVDYASDDSVPGRLFPLPGTDLTGNCWYYSSFNSDWVQVQLFADGSAILGYSRDPISGGFAILTGVVPRCTSEPSPLENPTTLAWDYVMAYIHPPPQPELNPQAGDGVTGLDTFLGVAVPEVHTAVLTTGGGLSLDVFIEVSALEVGWGDDTISVFPLGPTDFTGWPDGDVTHVYETKDREGYTITVAYDWTARWRVGGGPWQLLAVPNTTTAVNYPVAEIISVITE